KGSGAAASRRRTWPRTARPTRWRCARTPAGARAPTAASSSAASRRWSETAAAGTSGPGRSRRRYRTRPTPAPSAGACSSGVGRARARGGGLAARRQALEAIADEHADGLQPVEPADLLALFLGARHVAHRHLDDGDLLPPEERDDLGAELELLAAQAQAAQELAVEHLVTGGLVGDVDAVEHIGQRRQQAIGEEVR